MFTRPGELADSDVVDALANGWGLVVTDIEYAAVGYGSHHWRAAVGEERWFVTVDDLDSCRRNALETREAATERLNAALTVARSLNDSGLGFVTAPRPTTSGRILQHIDDRFVAALYPHVDGETHPWGAYPTRTDRLNVLDRIVRVHQASADSDVMARIDDFEIPGRDALEKLIADRSIPWGPGPYADGSRRLLSQHREPLGRILSRYDALVVDVASRPERMVLTHGEPHRANTITTPSGVVLIDWDTALLAPPERDLWSLIDEDSTIATEYTSRTGVDVDDAAIQTYRLWWDLCEISLYTALFRAPHTRTQDTRVAWEGLQTYLDPDRWDPPNRSG